MGQTLFGQDVVQVEATWHDEFTRIGERVNDPDFVAKFEAVQAADADTYGCELATECDGLAKVGAVMGEDFSGAEYESWNGYVIVEVDGAVKAGCLECAYAEGLL